MSCRWRLAFSCLCAAWIMAGCQTNHPHDQQRAQATSWGKVPSYSEFTPSQEARDRILALDPARLSEKDIREVLAGTPAPRVINIHGGLLPIEGSLASFSEFLVGMGYPRSSIQNPRDGSYAFGYYLSSKQISGVVAWYYEREGLRPVIVGHSQGGIQAIKVLYVLNGDFTKRIPVWNPLTWKSEGRYDFIDPLTGTRRPVVGLRLPYATAVVAGGLGRALPNQWEMNGKLRDIPDSVEEFTGFQKGMDFLGGDFFGYGRANDYRPRSEAIVRNVRLPSTYSHTTIPNTSHLLKDQRLIDWINSYLPGSTPLEEPRFDGPVQLDSSHILWAAEVWYSLKKHWVIELQHLLQSRSPPR